MSVDTSLKIGLAAGVLVLGGIAAYLGMQLNQAQSNAASVTAERDQLKANVSQLNAKAEDLDAKVQQLNKADQQLTAANASAEQEVRRESMPELPVSVYFHKALLGGKSYVAEFTSHGSGDMAVAVEWTDGATHNQRKFRVDVAPGRRPTPVGHLQGYDFEPGDMLTLSHDGFKPVSAQVRQ